MTVDDHPSRHPSDADPGKPVGDPSVIGPYRLLRRLGEGGMGVVYEAEQSEPVHRRVALKIIKLGLDTKEFIARFEAERQALAVMDHPNIARIHDGGSTATGRPYFVMELVHGVPITEYCDTNKLSLRERLELFLAVCSGVHHAHQKGIIHRDLKPSNVLTAVEGDRVIAKVIDFGVAKALGQQLTERTLVTEFGRPIGTPEYMSPEQAEASTLDVDTRTDIYSLGVMLYELLVGALPIDVGRRRALGGVMRHVLRDVDVPTPSRRFESLADARRVVAERRRTDPAALGRELKSDLDWIVMRAIEKDRTRRYDSAAALAADIERHLRREPVLARPPTVRYRAGKFARRHWAGVAAGGVAFVALTAGAITATLGLVRARAAEREARQEAETARQVADFVVDLFRVSAPTEALGNTITAREILDQGAVDIRGRLDDQPAVKARMMAVIGAVYHALGLFDEAEPMLDEALAIQRSALGPGHGDLMHTLVELSSLAQGRGQPARALQFAEEALDIALAAHGAEHQMTAIAHQSLGMAYLELGEFDAAGRHLDRAVAIRHRLLGPDDLATAAGLAQLGWLHRMVGDYHEARELYTRVIEIGEGQLPAGHPYLAASLSDLGVVLNDLGEYDEARVLYERALAIREQAYGPDHVLVAASLNNLGALEWLAGDLEAAGRHYERAIAVYEAALGPESLPVGRGLGNLALLRHRQDEFREARDLYVRALALEESVYGPDHVATANTLNNYGWLLRYIGELEAAQEILERSLAIRERAFGPDNPNLVGPLTNLAYLHRDRGEYGRAREHAERLVAITAAALPEDHGGVGNALTRLASALVWLGDFDAALPMLHRARAIIPEDDEPVLELATLHLRRGDHAVADTLFAHWLGMIEARDGAQSAGLSFAQGVARAIRGDTERALDHLRIAVERGYSDPLFTRHYSLAGLRGDPRYLDLAAEVRRRAGID